MSRGTSGRGVEVGGKLIEVAPRVVADVQAGVPGPLELAGRARLLQFLPAHLHLFEEGVEGAFEKKPSARRAARRTPAAAPAPGM